jgi:malonate decarboxylase gamma subunit
MTLADILASLFPAGHTMQSGVHDTWHGTGRSGADGDIALIGVAGGTPFSIDAAILLADHVLSVVRQGGQTPILLLVDTGIQNMTRRDELLGLNEYLGHLAKTLMLAAMHGHRTVGLLYGNAAGGAFIATAASTQVLAALPGANPSVMDLPSIARVTKLPLGALQEMAKSTPIFAPGLEPLLVTGAVTEVWDPEQPLAGQFAASLRQAAELRDSRDETGLARKGRKLAAAIAKQVAAEAAAHA